MDSTSPEMRQEYREVDHKRRVLASKITHVVTFFFVPAGSVLDYFVYPEHFVSFLILRLTAACIIALLFALHFTKTGRKYIVALPLALGLITAGCICWMISATEGHASPYYGGLNLVILGFTVLLPWTYQETSILGAGTLLMYLAACLLDSPTPIPYNASFFILLTTIACAVSSYYTSTARFQDFLLRHELDVRNKKLEEMDQLKSRFFANISHEFRTPLTLILSPVDDLLRNNQNLPTHVQDTLLLVSNNALRLLKLINDLLETMRLEESSLQEDDTFVDLATFLPGICDSIRHLTQKKKIKLIVEGEKGPILVNGDPNRLEKVFLNLLTNAVKFTPEGGSIKVQWTRENEEVLINITDTGIGIPEGELSKIFDRFHQVDGSSKRRHQGVGIGLALVKEIIAKHNGTLSVDSELDHGTKFTIRLPLPEIDANASLAPVARPEVPSPSEPMAAAFKSADHYVVSSPINSEDLPVVGQGPTSILVVDDEPDMRRFLVSMLSGEHTVFQAADGDAGIRIAEAEKPDLILLDWMLPGKHGLEVCQILRANDQLKHLKIILLTAKVDEASKIRALQQGADDFLTKPFSSIEVKTRIATQLDTLELQRNLQSQNVELEQTLRELRNTEAKLIQSEKINSLGVLSAGLLHEVNNPLNYTMTALHFLKTSLKEETFSEESSEEIDDTLVDIDDGMQRIKKIVSDLHTFAYPEKESSLTELYVSKQVESALRLLAHELKDIKLEIQVAESSVIRGSATQFIHVLLNLISNSAKAVNSVRETRTPIIRIKDRQENDSTFIEIWDNGSGIKPENLTRIFDPFFTTRDVGAGMGMGLSICHTIVKNHHGVISCDSKVGEWTSMTIELPNDPVSKPYEKTNQLTAA